MEYSDMHIHGGYSDGKGTFPEFIKSAAKKNITSLGFSDHSPVPLENSWSMKKSSLGSYLKDLSKLKNDYSGSINLYAGMELDYIPGIDVKGYIDFDYLPLDYFIGSVHYVYSEKLDKYLEVDGPAEDFKFLVEAGFNGDAEAVYKSYYNNVREMISAYIPAIIAHLDLITKNNTGGKYFSTNSESYMEEVEETLNMIKLYGTIVEINSGAMSRGYTNAPYPSAYILSKCFEKEIPMALNSDAHSADTIAYEFDAISDSIKKMGFRELITYQNGKWIPAQL